MNVEYLIDVFTTINSKPGGVCDACTDFMKYLSISTNYGSSCQDGRLKYSQISIPPSQNACSRRLEIAEPGRLLTHASKLSRERADDHKLARTLRQLSDMHSRVRLFKGDVPRAGGASEIYEWLSDTVQQAACSLIELAWLFQVKYLSEHL